ncbi:hypothetical protein QJ854_gp936 [Moumouvirus goulette]|uniref:Uncharacterized protein n=1 Tax=Moumouvirus goulette TaxID=1247379 RepID=M1PLQ1_9VIRU|nr:hypothetical protein QJ854_gp936 [Moumouvirus goulette]AGF84846.1 hypothetical protein glt_00037 [Moumouvirus goulette]
MVLSDFIYLKNEEVSFPTISLKKNLDHKEYNYYDKNTHPKHVENIEALFLIKKARESFLTHKKIKDKHMKKKYIKAGLVDDKIKRYFYLSGDKKFYCIYFNVSDHDFMGCYFGYYIFGIIERSSGEHLLIENKFWSGAEDGCCVLHNIFDYYPSDNYEQTCTDNPLTMLSMKTNDKIDDHHKPLDIIDSLEDYFLTFFKELSNLD